MEITLQSKLWLASLLLTTHVNLFTTQHCSTPTQVMTLTQVITFFNEPFSDTFLGNLPTFLHYSKLLLRRTRSTKNTHRTSPGGKDQGSCVRRQVRGKLPHLPLPLHRNCCSSVSRQSEASGHGDTHVPTSSLPSISNRKANHRV